MEIWHLILSFVTQIESCKWLPGQFLKSYRHGSEADEMHTSKNDSHWPCHSYLWTCLSERDSHQHKGFRDSSIGIWKQYKRCQENMKRLKALEEVKKCRNVKSLFCHDAACEEALARHNPLPSAGALGEMYWDRANADDTNRIQLGFSQHSSFARKRARTRIDPIVSLQRCTCWAVAKSTLFRHFTMLWDKACCAYNCATYHDYWSEDYYWGKALDDGVKHRAFSWTWFNDGEYKQM